MSEPPGIMGGYSDGGVGADIGVDMEAGASDVGDDMVKLFVFEGVRECVATNSLELGLNLKPGRHINCARDSSGI